MFPLYHYNSYFKDPDMFWDFITLRPETTHQVSFLFSDRGTPAGYRHMNGYGSHTFKLVNADGEAVYCKVISYRNIYENYKRFIDFIMM